MRWICENDNDNDDGDGDDDERRRRRRGTEGRRRDDVASYSCPGGLVNHISHS